MYQRVGNGFAVFASKGGSDTNPSWFHNISAHPDVSIEVGGETIDVRARMLTGEERADIWDRQKLDYPMFGEYERKTARREIPVILLEPM